MQHIYRKAPILKYGLTKMALQLYEVTLQHGYSLAILLHIFRIPFQGNISSRGRYFVLNVYLYMDWFLIFKNIFEKCFKM